MPHRMHQVANSLQASVISLNRNTEQIQPIIGNN